MARKCESLSRIKRNGVLTWVCGDRVCSAKWTRGRS
jgi:hypothetical protein